jgi:hypothetical protein
MSVLCRYVTWPQLSLLFALRERKGLFFEGDLYERQPRRCELAENRRNKNGTPDSERSRVSRLK